MYRGARNLEVQILLENNRKFATSFLNAKACGVSYLTDL